MHVDLEARARGVKPEDALKWWTDFQGGHVDHSFFPGTERRILANGSDGITMEDRARLLKVLPVFHERTTAWVAGSHVRFEGENTFSRFAGAYLFEPHPEGGTRIRLMANIKLKRGLSWTDRAAARVARRVLEKDLNGHARELEEDLGRESER